MSILEKRILEAKIKVANDYLNRLLNEYGRVLWSDIFDVCTPSMREQGARMTITELKKEDANGYYEFITLKEAV